MLLPWPPRGWPFLGNIIIKGPVWWFGEKKIKNNKHQTEEMFKVLSLGTLRPAKEFTAISVDCPKLHGTGADVLCRETLLRRTLVCEGKG